MARPTRFDQIAHAIRTDIAQRHLAPGTELPAREEYMRHHLASKATIQKALAVLVADGLIEVSRGRLTRVAAKPQHWNVYGIAFPDPFAGQQTRSRFYATVEDTFTKLVRETGGSVRIYHRISYDVDATEYARLVHDIEEGRLAGLILVHNSSSFSYRQVYPWQTMRLPVVGIGGESPCPADTFFDVDRAVFIETALDYLVGRRRRRLALLLPGEESISGQFAKGLSARGLKFIPEWILHVRREGVLNTVRLLAQGRDRPDGIVIADDHLTAPAVEGLRSLGLAIPADVDLVSSVNFPNLQRVPSPVYWLGWDIPDLVRRCCASIRQIKQGKTVPRMQWMPPVPESAFGQQ